MLHFAVARGEALCRKLRRVSPSSLRLPALYSLVLSLILTAYLLFQPSNQTRLVEVHRAFDDFFDRLSAGPEWHPIEHLIIDARKKHEMLLRQRSTTLKTAAARYRERRGRHPPPGFDKWFAYAKEQNAVVIEAFFDRVDHDLRPYWGLEPNETLARAAAVQKEFIQIRNGVAKGVGNTKNRPPWLQLWTKLINEAAPGLPDMSIPINYMDEPRLLIPSEDVDELVKKAEAQKTMTPKVKTLEKFGPRIRPEDLPTVPPPEWHGPGGVSYWEHVRAACPRDTPGHEVAALDNFQGPPESLRDWHPPFAEAGFIQNFTAARDPCLQPHLRGMHASFIAPVSLRTAHGLYPLFSGSKLPNNNDILIPGAMYLTKDAMYSGGHGHGPPWPQKKDRLVWRGVASGGHNGPDNWARFQRHRLIEMLNGTTIGRVEAGELPRPFTFALQEAVGEPGHLINKAPGALGSWMADLADAGFTELLCAGETRCEYVAPYYAAVPALPMQEQYTAKFLPDVDGNSFSARFRALLHSTALPLKATVYTEWHDDRLQPWLHFAPLDNTLRDLWPVLEYFTRDARGDAAARALAEAGKNWAERVLRRQDMLLYVWRLLLEYARVTDPDRDLLGFVADLV